jgi:hypothetical protein
MRGRSAETDRFRKRHRPGYDYLHVAVDDHSRVAFVRVFSDEQGETAARFLLEAAGFFADRGIRIERVLTDRHNSYRLSRSFHRPSSGSVPATSSPAATAPRPTAMPNDSSGTMLAEWAYVRLCRANEECLRPCQRRSTSTIRGGPTSRGRPPADGAALDKRRWELPLGVPRQRESPTPPRSPGASPWRNARGGCTPRRNARRRGRW